MSIQTCLLDLLEQKSACNNNVVTAQKGKFIQIRSTEALKKELQIVADLRGLSMSSLIHSLIKQAIREEKEREPKAFILTPIHSTLQVDSFNLHKVPLSPDIGEKPRQRKKA